MERNNRKDLRKVDEDYHNRELELENYNSKLQKY